MCVFQVVPTTEDGGAGLRNSILHLSAKNGYCSEFESFIGNDVVDLPNADSIPQRNSIAKGRKEKEQEIVREQDICADPAVRVLMLNN